MILINEFYHFSQYENKVYTVAFVNSRLIITFNKNILIAIFGYIN